MTFEEANMLRKSIDNTMREISQQLQTFPCGPMGLTPDDVKRSREYRTLSTCYRHALSMYRDFNVWFIPTFEKEYREHRRTKRQSRVNLFQEESQC